MEPRPAVVGGRPEPVDPPQVEAGGEADAVGNAVVRVKSSKVLDGFEEGGDGGTYPGGGAATASGSSRSTGKSARGSSMEGGGDRDGASVGTPAKPLGTAGLPVDSSDAAEPAPGELMPNAEAMSLADAALPAREGATADGAAPSALAIFRGPVIEPSAGELPRVGGGSILGAFKGRAVLAAAAPAGRPGAVLFAATEEAAPEELPPEELTPVKLTPVELTLVELTLVELTPVELTPVELTPVELTATELTPEELTPEELAFEEPPVGEPEPGF